MDGISEIMQAVYSLAQFDRMFTGFSEMIGSWREVTPLPANVYFTVMKLKSSAV